MQIDYLSKRFSSLYPGVDWVKHPRSAQAPGPRRTKLGLDVTLAYLYGHITNILMGYLPKSLLPYIHYLIVLFHLGFTRGDLRLQNHSEHNYYETTQ